ncbi:alpha-ketoacid dehydrogenase subunit beta [Agromyces soli]|uniref:Alpha-ketoacid dehydrogenase subunit beta n=1 Tax=Agromyces soli TaxID=659012 RepID=A0ABY4AWF7_9MICO|nr:transketolase C-terminal domain-containing protein [Agromyces soli]UOE27164.1 alpha-ketoacid dehydrogenase subunit beta [Agromyces soli]
MPEIKNLSYIQAVNHALRWSLETVPNTVVFGEDVAVPGGPFGATKNLHRDFGVDRVFDLPISETAFLGMALGSAMTGLRPIAEIMYSDFLFVAMDQVVNQIANIRYTSNGKWGAPLVIRTQQGSSPGACAQHSKSIEAYLAHTPGLRVVCPTTPMEAYQAIRTAVVSDDPVFVVESRMLYPQKGEVQLDAELWPMGGARVVRPGADATIVAWSRTMTAALEAGEQLAARGVDAEVVDLRWIAPLDVETVADSVAKTGRLVIAHDAPGTGGFGGELAARVGERCFGRLRAPIARVTGIDAPLPAAPALQDVALPSADRIAGAVLETMSA